MDFIFTVCDQAANEHCPVPSGQPLSAHWGQPDPALTDPALPEVSEADRLQAYQQAFDTLTARITAFTALPIDQLDRATLQSKIDAIGLTAGG